MLASCRKGNASSGIVSYSDSSISLKELTFSDIPSFNSQDFKSTISDYRSVCTIINKQDRKKYVSSNSISLGTVLTFQKICRDFAGMQNASNADILKYFKSNFTPFLVHNTSKQSKIKGLFTGYYHPTINGSSYKHDKFIYPIYKKPKDLIAGKPYYTRKEIYNGALNDKDLELFWTDDMVAFFMFQVQGSGIVKLDGGQEVHLSYDGKNNRPYRSIGQYMMEKNISSGKTQSEINDWLRANPEKMKDILSINESYIFFKVSQSDNIVGAHGSNLIAGRSLAVDARYIPYGAILYLETENSGQNIMFAQDTGSAITGPIRGDIFYGTGESAYNIAQKMKDYGSYYILVPNKS